MTRKLLLAKLLVFSLALLPFLWLLLASFNLGGQSLGANPVEKLLETAGLWGLRFLLLTLAVTPLRQITGRVWLLRFRRPLGLFAFFYLLLHFLVYALLDQGMDPGAIGEDILERPYITLGMAALLMLLPLAVTSTKGWMRRLGRNWKKLHRLIYAAAILGVWHFFWQVRLDTREALIYALILALLLGWRLVRYFRSRVSAAA